MLSGIANVPELTIAESEATELAKALNTVNQFYKVEVAEKTVAWINLAMVGGMIYGSRFVAIRQRRRAARGIRQERANPAFHPAPTAPMPSPVGEAPEQPQAFDPADAGEVPDDFVPGFWAPGNGPVN